LELDTALSKAGDVAPSRRAHAEALVRRARDTLARAHLEDGRTLAEQGHLERAYECWETALEVVASDDLRDEIRAGIAALEAGDARAVFEESAEMSDEERFQVLSGAWEDERADELEEYGDVFKEAFLKLHDGDADAAVEVMSRLLEEYPDAIFLHLELGIALRNAGESGRATGHLKQFLERVEEELDAEADENDEEVELPVPDARVQAHATLAEIYLETKDADAAEDELRQLVDLLPEKAGPYVHLGAFLREQERFDEALEALRIGEQFMGSIRPDMRVARELGLTFKALGDRPSAVASLRSVIEYQAGLSDFNFDPVTAAPLAELYEEEGQLREAADLWRHLAAGSHAAGHARYNLDAGRLLAKIGDHTLARKHLTRALELLETPEDRERAESLLGSLPA
jgi:tetratricopeptide (TPR) repeat protein